MEEKELFEAWKKVDANEEKVFAQHEGDYAQLAQKKSNDIFRKINNNIISEAIATVVAIVAFPFLFLSEPVFFWLIMALMLLSTAVCIKVYARYLKDMKHLNELDLATSLKKKLNILKRYVKQLNLYMIIFSPIGFAVGFIFALKEEELGLMRIIVISGISLPFLGLVIWLGRKYIYALYGKHIKRVEEIYLSLIEN